MGTLELRSELHKPGQKSLSWPQGQRMLLVRRAGGSGNCLLWFRRDVASLRTVQGYMLKRQPQKSVCHCPGRISALQTPRRPCCVKGLLRCAEVHHGAKGCEVMVSGKLQGQRAKPMKFVDGLMIHSGDSVNYYADASTRHVLLRQGVLGIKI